VQTIVVTKLEQFHGLTTNPLFLRMRLPVPAWMNWERWPFKLVYFPITPIWLWYCLRSRSVWFFSSSNPTITFGGMEGEGKREMYDQLPTDLYPQTQYAHPTEQFNDLLDRVRSAFALPIVVKPDVGMKGLWFERIDSWEELEAYHREAPVEYVIQAWVGWPVEVSIFYHRHPAKSTGTISGFIEKTLLQVVGDGQSTLVELIRKHPKASGRLAELSVKHEQHFERTLDDGEVYLLSYAANHNRGAFFYNLQHRITPELAARFDDLSHKTRFYYGRYDLKIRSVDDFCSGGDFSILEFNGCGAEPNHIYDCGMSLWQAYRIILQHWRALFEISRHNHQSGHTYWGFWKGLRFLRSSAKHFERLSLARRSAL
jgi:hypothetical protein